MEKSERPLLISITPGAVIKIIAILVVFYLLFLVRDVLLALLASVVIATAIEPITRTLVRKKVPRVIAVLFIYIVMLTGLSAVIYLFLPPFVQETQQIITSLPGYVASLNDNAGQFKDIPAIGQFIDQISEIIKNEDVITKIGGSISGATFSFLSAASAIFGGILSFIFIIVLSFYLAVQENGVSNFLRIITPIQHEKYIIDLWNRTQKKIGYWMQGQLILALIVGVMTYLGLSVLGIQNALVLALIAAVFELIPVFGPILSAVPAIGFALLQGGLTLALLVVGLYVIVQQFESQLIHPLVVKKMVGIPALVAIIALIVGAKIAGFLGIILSVPVTTAIMEYINDIERKKSAEMKNESA